jgi:zinc finger SWIM domain-containing protein 3
VQYSIKAAEKCYWIEAEDAYHTIRYVVRRVDKGEKQYFVKCEICVVERILKAISCSCQKLQSLGTPALTSSLSWAIAKNTSFQIAVF